MTRGAKVLSVSETKRIAPAIHQRTQKVVCSARSRDRSYFGSPLLLPRRAMGVVPVVRRLNAWRCFAGKVESGVGDTATSFSGHSSFSFTSVGAGDGAVGTSLVNLVASEDDGRRKAGRSSGGTRA